MSINRGKIVDGRPKWVLRMTLGVLTLMVIPAVYAADDSTPLDEIVVTARKRSENVETVPITIDVLSGTLLSSEGVTRTEDLQYSVPGFYVENYESRGTVTMRGVGTQVDGSGSSVATHVDGIYESSSAASLNRLFDVDQVEVLKGPQGTVFGRNSTGGALNIITNKPGKDFDVTAGLYYGSYDSVRLESALNTPISDSISARTALAGSTGDGQITNVFDGRKVGSTQFFAGRESVAAEFGSVKVDYFAQYVDDQDDRAVTLVAWSLANRAPLYGWDKTADDDPLKPYLHRKVFLTGLTLSSELGAGFALKSITGYLDYNESNGVDCNPALGQTTECIEHFPQYAHQISEELQLNYSSDKLNGVLGAYFLNDDEGEHRHADFLPIIPNLFNSRSDNTLKVAALFGDASYGLTDKLRLNAGVRFNHEETGTHYVGTGVFDAPDSDVGGTQNATTGRLGLDYTFHPGLMVYGTLSKGFQSGYFAQNTNADGTSSIQDIKPETLYSLELGVKADLPNHAGVFNLSGFYYDYRDIQVDYGAFPLLPNGQPNPNQPPFFGVSNAAKARIDGIDTNLTDLRLADYVHVSFNAEYLDAKFKDYTTLDPTTLLPVDYSGNTLPRAPKLSATTALEIGAFQLSSIGKVSARVDYTYRTLTYFTPADTLTISQGGYGMLGALATLKLDGGHWLFTAGGRNLLGKRAIDYADGSAFVTVVPFRTWEVGAHYQFR